MPPPPPATTLRKLLLEVFARKGDLETFIGDNYPEVEELVAWDQSEKLVADHVAKQLAARGELGDELFDALVGEIPGQADRINRARDECLGGPAFPPADPARRRQLAVAGVAAVLAVGALAVIIPNLGSESTDGEAVATTTSTPATTASPDSTTTIVVEESLFRTDPLTGTFNVAVVAFAAEPEDDPSASREAVQAARDLVAFLESELGDTAPDIPLLSRVDIGLFERPPPPEEGTEDLQGLASEVNADIVVSATLRSSDAPGSSFAPRFAVRLGRFERSDQLAGDYGLGASQMFVSGFESPAVRTSLRETMKRRSCILVHLVAGLSLYRETFYGPAAQSFRSAAEATGCPAALATGQPAAEGQEIAYLFLGSIEMLNGRLDEADAWYDRALEVAPGFVRARFAKAEVAFQRARADCLGTDPPPPDELGPLRAARADHAAAFDAYRTARQEGEAQVSFLASQARLQAGRIELCLAVAESSSLEAAREEFGLVVDDYLFASSGDEQRRLSDFAAEAYAGLGFISLVEDTELDQALAQFTEAIELGRDTDRRALFLAARAHVLGRLGQADEAAADCEQVGATAECPLQLTGDFLGEFTNTLPFTGVPGGARIPLVVMAGVAALALGTLLISVSRNERGERRARG